MEADGEPLCRSGRKTSVSKYTFGRCTECRHERSPAGRLSFARVRSRFTFDTDTLRLGRREWWQLESKERYKVVYAVEGIIIISRRY